MYAACRQLVAQAFGIIGSIGDKSAGVTDHRDKTSSTGKIVSIPCCNQQGERTATLLGQRVDFGRLPPARAADGIVERPPFPPEAER